MNSIYTGVLLHDMLKCGMVTKRLEGEGKEEVEEERGRGAGGERKRSRSTGRSSSVVWQVAMRVMRRACICLMRAKTLADFLKKDQIGQGEKPWFSS